MVSSGILRRVALVRTVVSVVLSASSIRVLLRSVRRLLVTASIVPNSPILVTLMGELSSSETSVLTKATRRNIPEDTVLQSLNSVSIDLSYNVILIQRFRRYETASWTYMTHCIRFVHSVKRMRYDISSKKLSTSVIEMHIVNAAVKHFRK
jgi:hypothetical protein